MLFIKLIAWGISMSFNNPKCSLSDFLMQKKQQISYEINNLNNDIIMANTAQDIVNNIQTKYMLEVIQYLIVK